MEAAAGNPTRPAPVKVRLMLLLTPSPASKTIAKAGGVKRVQLDGAFQCRTCGRQFATFQALGGHRTSHKRPRVRADGLELLLGTRPGSKHHGCAGGGRAASTPAHRCDTCGKVFPTGQALGGHMRRHRPLGSSAAVPTTWMEETTAAATMSGSSEIIDDNENDALSYKFIQFM